MIGEILINERVALKMQESVPASKSVKIYVVGGLLTSGDEVSQAMSRNPNPGSNPFKRVKPRSSLRHQIKHLATENEETLVDPSYSSSYGGAEVEPDADIFINVEDDLVQKMANFAATKILENRNEETMKSLKVKFASLQKLPEIWRYKMCVEIIVSKSSKLACTVVVDKILATNEEDAITIPILNKSNCKSLKTEK